MKVLIRSLYLLVLVAGFNRVAQASELDPQKIGFAPVPDWVEVTPVDSTVTKTETRDIHYLMFDYQINIATLKKQNFTRLTQKVMTQQGLSEASKLEISFAPAYEKIVLHELHILRDNKKLDRLVKDNIKLFQQETALGQGMYQEGWQALIILNDIRIGDIVQYSFSIQGSNPVLGNKHFGSTYLNWGTPLENYHFRLLSRADQHLDYQLENSKIEVLDSTVEGLRVIEIAQQDVSAVQLEDRYPSWFNLYAMFEFSQFKNWREVNDWALALYPATDKLPTELKTLLSQQKFANKLDAITFVTQWIQDNVRYFGIETGVNSHRPSKPGDTLIRRYGDCKDKTVLLNSALRHFGYRSCTCSGVYLRNPVA